MAVVGEIGVLVLERREVFRLGLAAMLDAIPGVERRDGPGAGTVDVVLASPELLAGAPPGARRLAVVDGRDPGEIEAAVSARPDGYLPVQELTSASLRAAVVGVVAGDLPPPEVVTAYLLESARGGGWTARAATLTPREEDVLELLVAGHSDQEIATRLGISVPGAKRHVSSILHKLDSPSRSHLVSRARQARAVAPREGGTGGSGGAAGIRAGAGTP